MCYYVFDTYLLLNLSRVLRVKQIDICASYGGDPGTYVYRVNHGTFPLDDLVNICNEYHVPMSWFIVPDGMTSDVVGLPSRNDLVCSGEWNNIENMFGLFGVQFAKANGVGNEQASKLCGISVSNYYNMFINDEGRWKKCTVKNYLKIMNNAKIYAGEYVRDNNRPIRMISGYHELGYNKNGVQNEIMNEHYHRQAISMNNRLMAKMETMEAEMEKMRRELSVLRGMSYVERVAEDVENS